jgi:lipopolysaccharide/colanic/teichoic acid biosynthesis glycosyltransferase
MNELIYIGKSTQIRFHLLELLGDNLKCFYGIDEVCAYLCNEKEEESPIVFYESVDLKHNLDEISLLQSYKKDLFFILIATDLSKKDSLQYLKQDVFNTISPEVTKPELDGVLNFIKKRQSKFVKDIKDDHIIEFYLPCWKRLFDIIISLFAIICLSPLLIITAILIRLESKGSIIYKSKRVGCNYHVFDFLKFRSMYTNADKKLSSLKDLNKYASEESAEPEVNREVQMAFNGSTMLVSDDFVISEDDFLKQKSVEQGNSFVKLENDPRITRVGHFIRKYSIDELPQLFNILKGDMSVVGNRPLPLYEAELLTTDDYIDRFMGPAGLTGLWQVMKRGESGRLSAEERKQLDIQYAKTFSFVMDIKIILKTLTAFIQKDDV